MKSLIAGAVPPDTKQLPLGRHHLAKRTPAQLLLAGSHRSPAEQRRTLRPTPSGAIDRLDRPSLHHSYQVALAKPHMPSDLHESYAAAFNPNPPKARVGDQSSYPLALDQPENQIPKPGGHLRAPQPLGNTKSSPNCFKETCFNERCQALSPLPPLPVRPGPHLDHLGCSSSLSVYNWPQTNSGQGPATGFKHPT